MRDNDKFHQNLEVNELQQMTTCQKLNKNVLCLILFLNMIGGVLIIIGLSVYSQSSQLNDAIAYLVLGCICILPGGYSLYKIIMAFRATTAEERDHALEGVPE